MKEMLNHANYSGKNSRTALNDRFSRRATSFSRQILNFSRKNSRNVRSFRKNGKKMRFLTSNA